MPRPSGTVTFLFTDIEGSTRLWDDDPEAMRVALARHDEILRASIEAHDGVVFATGGDGFAAAFARASGAVGASVEAQRTLGSEVWPAATQIRVRMGIHTGEAHERDGDYFGAPLNRAARVMAVGHGGQILVSATTAGIVSGVDVLDLGEHRLRDLSGVEHLFQVRADGLRVVFGRLRTPDVVPGNLPLRTSSLLGRDEDLNRVAALVGANRLVTLVGVGGVGKTRLAVAVAAELVSVTEVERTALRDATERYRDGAWFCELADVAPGGAIIDALAMTLGVRRQRGKTLLASIASSFADAQALVILDNCEHVLLSTVEVLATLDSQCPGVKVLVTSRESLGVSGEVVYPLRPLPVPDGEELAVSSAAFELFVERAGQRGVVVDADPASRVAVVEICRRLDGLPLGIELAAARVSTMSVLEMSTRLDERFRLLARTRTDRPHRQQTLWDVVDWSFQLLDSADQELFSHLAVFLGGFTIAAAAAVSGRAPADVEEAVWGLTARSLVQVAPTGAPESRYQLLETMRHFALARLTAAGRARHAQDAHMRYFLALVREASDAIRGADEGKHVKRITNDLANVRAAHHHAITTRAVAEAAGLVTGLHEYAEWRQFFELGTWAQAVLGLEERPSPATPALRAITGWARCIAGDFEAATDHAHRGLAAEAATGTECGWLHDVLAHCAHFQGDPATGLVHGDHEIARARISGDPYRLSYVLADSGTHASVAGDSTLGHERASEALLLATRINNPAVLSMAQLARGFATRVEDPQQSIEWFRRAAALADTVDSTWTSAICRGELSMMLALHGDPHEALQLGLTQMLAFRRAGDTARLRGSIPHVLPALHHLIDGPQRLDLVTLHAGTTDRLRLREPFIDDTVAHVIAQITEALGQAAVDEALSRGARMDDAEVLELALATIQAAINPPPDSVQTS